jgi:hypothetical protein
VIHLAAQLAVHLHRQFQRRSSTSFASSNVGQGRRARTAVAERLPQFLGHVRREGGQHQHEILRQLARQRHGRPVISLFRLINSAIAVLKTQRRDVLGDLFDRPVHLPIERFGDWAIGSRDVGAGDLLRSPAKLRQTRLRKRDMPTMSRVFHGFWASSGPMYIS